MNTSLRTLYLGHNKITQLPSLKTSSNTSSLQDSVCVACSSLEVIDLEKNYIKCIDVFHLSNMANLREMQLFINQIRRFPDPGCASSTISANATVDWYFPRLSKFTMKYSTLTELPLLPGMGKLSSSAKIDLKGNWIAHVQVARLELLKNATNLFLRLTLNQITEMPYLSILGPALVHADLINNRITYLYQKHLSGLINWKPSICQKTESKVLTSAHCKYSRVYRWFVLKTTVFQGFQTLQKNY